MIFVGIDPDLHCTAIGVWEDGQPIDAWVIETKKKKGVIEQAAVLEMAHAIPYNLPLYGLGDKDEGVYCVEAQTLHVTGVKQHNRPQDIVTLGNVAGAILGVLFTKGVRAGQVMFPTAKEWKGQIPKAVMQARFYIELGWGYHTFGSKTARYSVPILEPKFAYHLKQSDWRHVGDALMLAKWASENWQE